MTAKKTVKRRTKAMTEQIKAICAHADLSYYQVDKCTKGMKVPDEVAKRFAATCRALDIDPETLF